MKTLETCILETVPSVRSEPSPSRQVYFNKKCLNCGQLVGQGSIKGYVHAWSRMFPFLKM